MTTAELARAEMVKPQSMGTLLAELEQDGLVQRQPHPTDGRQILFSLTEARAWRRGASATRPSSRGSAAAIDRLDADEQRTLADAIALVDRSEKADACPSPRSTRRPRCRHRPADELSAPRCIQRHLLPASRDRRPASLLATRGASR